MEERRELDRALIRLEAQVGRLVSDAESEKGTRRRRNIVFDEKFEKLDQRIRAVERYVWMALGGLYLIEAAVRFIPK